MVDRTAGERERRKRAMKIGCVWEHNGDDTILYAIDLVGAFARGASREEALRKLPRELISYGKWAGDPIPEPFEVEISQEKCSELNIRDADSDVLFESERENLTQAEYETLKRLVLKSARDVFALYESFPDKHRTSLPSRETFYGMVPRTAEEMYQHTKNVNAYYWGEIGVDADNEGTIVENRLRGFEALEAKPDFLTGGVTEGSYAEQWSLPKVLRRFLWHDRIHARAMYRMGVKTFGAGVIPDVFRFELE